MTTIRACPQCGAPLPQGVADWLCPKCLLGQAAGPAPTGSSPTPHSNPVLHYFGDYELLEEIARGGMGVVYRARQVSLNRIVAVKLLQFGPLAREEFRRRFRLESEAAASLQHPHIVAIHEVGDHEGQPFFSMDYVAGPNLAERVQGQPLPSRFAAALLRTVAEAIHYAHGKGILHRDLKPSNILLDAQDQPHITDFGLAKRLTDSVVSASEPGNLLTLTGQVLGTPGFMSPEQVQGRRDVSTSSDVYSLGALFYFLLTGRAPFAAESVQETLRQVQDQDPIPPRLLDAFIPRDLETVCLKCLSKEPGERYFSAQELAGDLDCFLRDEPIQARPAGRLEKGWRWCRRKPALAASLAAVFLLLITVAIGSSLAAARISRERGLAQANATRETAQRLRAEEAITSLELQRAEILFDKDEVTMAVAYLARMVRRQPTNDIAARRLLSALTQRDFGLRVAVPLRHDDRVWSAEFSPDGSRVVTAALDSQAAIWDVRTGSLVVALPHSHAVRLARFSPDALRVVTVADDFQARLWDAATGRALGPSMVHAKRIHAVEFSPDGRHVLTASSDGTAQLWDAQTGERALKPLRHKGAVNSARFSTDGQRLVTASDDRTAQVWEVHTGLPQGRPFQHWNGVRVAEFSPDGGRVVTAHDSYICVWAVSSGKKLATSPSHQSEMISLATFSPDGQRILTASSAGVARIWSASDWTPQGRPMSHRDSIWAAEFSRDGQRVVTASIDGTARVWDAETGEPVTAPLQHDDLVFSARFSADGMFIATASADQTARIWDVRSGAARSPLLPVSARWAGAVFSPEGETVASLAEGGTARLWNVRTGLAGPRLADPKPAIHLRWSSDGQRVAGFCADRTARIWDAQTGALAIQPIPLGQYVSDVKFSPDGQWLATAGHDGYLHQWNARTGEPRGQAIPHRDKIEFFAYSPDGQRLLCSDHKNDQARLHEAASGRLLAQTPERAGCVIHAAFSADGQRLITTSEDGIARIWRADTLQPLTEPLGHKGAVHWAAFSRDGLRAVTGSADGTARVWDATTGQPLGEPLTHRGAVTSAAFSPDDLLVATACRDGTARLWDAATGWPVTEPFRHRGELVSARFSPDGRRLLTVSFVDGARWWDVPPKFESRYRGHQSTHLFPNQERHRLTSSTGPENDALLLVGLAETVIGKRVNDRGALESSPPSRLTELRQLAAEGNTGLLSGMNPSTQQPGSETGALDDFTRWLKWFFADRSTRTASPYSPIGLAEYVAALADDEGAWRETLMLCPTNGMAFAQMARHRVRRNPVATRSDIDRADWASRQAVRFAPERSLPWQARIEVTDLTGGWTQLLAEVEQVIKSQPANADAWVSKYRCLTKLGQFEAVAQPNNAVFWNTQGLLHEKAGQVQQAEAAFAKALEIASLPVTSWDFESRRTSTNWNPIHQMANLVVEQGKLSFDATGEDPYLELYLPAVPVDGTTHRWFHVRMKNATSGDRAQVFWGTATDQELNEARAVLFPILPNDRQFTVYSVDMSHEAWTNNRIVRLRFDPASKSGHIDIDWICLHTDSQPPADIAAWAEIADPEMRRQSLSNLVRLRRK